jgi:hypothetical protein
LHAVQELRKGPFLVIQSTELGDRRHCLEIALEEVDQTIGGGVVAGDGGGVLQFGLDRLCQLLAQLHTAEQTNISTLRDSNSI